MNMLRYYGFGGKVPVYRDSTPYTDLPPNHSRQGPTARHNFYLRLRNTSDLYALSIIAEGRATKKELTQHLYISQDLIFRNKKKSVVSES